MTRNVAIIGASSNRSKYGNKAVRAFLRAGWNVYPVNPNEEEVEGLGTYRSLDAITDPIDVVTLYVPPQVGIKVLDTVAKRPGTEIWLNPGSANDALRAKAQTLNLTTKELCSIINVGFSPAQFPG